MAEIDRPLCFNFFVPCHCDEGRGSIRVDIHTRSTHSHQQLLPAPSLQSSTQRKFWEMKLIQCSYRIANHHIIVPPHPSTQPSTPAQLTSPPPAKTPHHPPSPSPHPSPSKATSSHRAHSRSSAHAAATHSSSTHASAAAGVVVYDCCWAGAVAGLSTRHSGGSTAHSVVCLCGVVCW